MSYINAIGAELKINVFSYAKKKSLSEDIAITQKCFGLLSLMQSYFSSSCIGAYGVHQSHQVGLILSQMNPTFGIFVENHSRKRSK